MGGRAGAEDAVSAISADGSSQSDDPADKTRV
jgi:hypothetical protein